MFQVVKSLLVREQTGSTIEIFLNTLVEMLKADYKRGKISYEPRDSDDTQSLLVCGSSGSVCPFQGIHLIVAKVLGLAQRRGRNGH